MQKLSTPRMLVRLASDDEKTLDIQATNRDLVLWDETRVKHRWPKFDDAPFLWLTFLSWSAARRTGVISPDTKFEEWKNDVLDISNVEDDGDTGNPTDAEPGPE